MDSLRGQFPDHGEPYGGSGDQDYDDETGGELPPLAIGQDERRMQVRAYNFWAGLLDDRTFPAIEDLDPEAQSDFGPHSVLLDFTAGIEDPAIAYLGEKLAGECGTDGPIGKLSDVPSRSLLSRITDHYLQIIANQAPIGFEAEFVNLRGITILYRGILLPFSSDDDTIDFIYGVINWKELADQQTTDELMLQIDQALETRNDGEREQGPLTDWADGPTSNDDILDLDTPLEGPEDAADLPEPAFAAEPEPVEESGHPEEAVAESTEETSGDEDEAVVEAPTGAIARPSFLGSKKPTKVDAEVARDQAKEAEDSDLEAATAGNEAESTESDVVGGADGEIDDIGDAQPGISPEDMGLADWLASARELAEEARSSEERTRKALYEAIGRAYDFSLAALEEPEEFSQLLDDAGLTIQDRAPMTPVVKLVFGADYDKTRLTEYAAALTHARHLGLGRGELADHLAGTAGGLKAVVAEERCRRRAESGEVPAPRNEVREALAKKLRKLETVSLDAIPADGSEFTVLVARRTPEGQIVLLGEVADDLPLIERAAKHLLK